MKTRCSRPGSSTRTWTLYVVNGTGPERLPTEIVDPNDSRLSDPEADCQSISTGLYSCVYQIDRPVNGPGGNIQGVELSYQQPIAGGFGVIANYTYSDASSDNSDPVPGNSKNTGNLTAYFENQRFGARLSYNYRSEYFIDNDRGRQLYSDATDTLDLSINVNITDNFAVTFDGVNLLDEELFQYYDDAEEPAGALLRQRSYLLSGCEVQASTDVENHAEPDLLPRVRLRPL